MSLDRHSDKMIVERKGRTVNHGKEAIEMALQRIASVAKILRKGAIVMLHGRSQLNENLQGDFSILRQISALRRENRFLKVGLIFCLVLSALPYLTGFQPEIIHAKRVVAEAIEFVRDEKTVMSITTGDKGNGLLFLDRGSNPAAWVNWGEDGGAIGVYNKFGKGVVSMGASPYGGAIKVVNNDGKLGALIGVLLGGGVIGVHDKDGKPVITMLVWEDGSIIEVRNPDGKRSVAIGDFKEGGRVEVCRKDGKPAVLADVVEGHGRVSIWNGRPKASAMMTVLSSGGAIALADENGKIVWTAP
jgi:hypothetical protein